MQSRIVQYLMLQYTFDLCFTIGFAVVVVVVEIVVIVDVEVVLLVLVALIVLSVSADFEIFSVEAAVLFASIFVVSANALDSDVDSVLPESEFELANGVEEYKSAIDIDVKSSSVEVNLPASESKGATIFVIQKLIYYSAFGIYSTTCLLVITGARQRN
jgi:hypothetical protein